MRVKGSKRFQAPVSLKSDDAAVERVRRSHDERIREIQNVPIVGGRLIKGIELENGVETPFSHGLGRPATVFVSPVRGTVERTVLVSSADMYPVVETANWTPPSGSTDYWEMVDTTEALQAPVPLQVGEILTGLSVVVYSGATDPSVTLYKANATDASATAVTPTVAWSAVPTGAWTVMTASYSSTIDEKHWSVNIICTAIGDRVRAMYVHTEAPPGTVREIRSSSYDPSRYSVLRADGWGATVTVDAWAF